MDQVQCYCGRRAYMRPSRIDNNLRPLRIDNNLGRRFLGCAQHGDPNILPRSATDVHGSPSLYWHRTLVQSIGHPSGSRTAKPHPYNLILAQGKISDEEGLISLGPWGGKGAVDWAYKPDGPIMQITIRYRAVIDSILFESKSCDGVVIGSPVKVRGDGDGSIKTRKISDEDGWISLGPWGGEKGAPWAYKANGPIMQISVRYGEAINSILFESKSYDGVVMGCSEKIGNSGGHRTETVLGSVVGSKPKTLENTIIHNAASSSATTNKDDHHGEAHNDLMVVESALREYVNRMVVQLDLAGEKFEDLQNIGGSERDFDELSKVIAKLKFQIPFTTSKHDHQEDGALSPTSKMIRSDLLLMDTAFAEAMESMYQMNLKIKEAHDKFKEIQMLPSSERDSNELRKAIGKLKVQISSNNKCRNADSNLHHKNWDNINGAEDGMTTFFYNEPEPEPEVTHTSGFDGLLKAFHELPEASRFCLSCFFKFPPMATIKRTPMIYLWIGQGYVSQYLHSDGYIWDVEVHAGKIFDDLIAKGFIEPIYQKRFSVPDSCRMSLFVRSSLYKEAKLRGFTSNGTDLDLNHKSVGGDLIKSTSCLINVGEAIVNWEPDIVENMKHIQSLYLGRWQNSATHHIELADSKILHGLNKLNSLTFLSLQGISMITELPKFISELNNLMILDVRACHNLEVIPNKIGLLKSLTHLDMSECYFLEHMPKSLAHLSNLQVLKGFLIGDIDNNKQSCNLLDLAGLEKLRKLNIYISVKDILRLQDLKYLERFEGLKKLTISWGGCSLQARAEDIAEAFHFAKLPPRLHKLDLQCFPISSLTDWLMPGKLTKLQKLYIRGGQLCDLGDIQKRQGVQWTVEILRLEYLSELELHWKELRILFPKLIYLHQVGCPKFFYFPCDKRGVWMDNKVIDTHMQLKKYFRASGTIN
ncbi:hypothetical protein RHMOL_Rhmol12G0049900 [Rhododendron molle]|uniref:Uncharacterized protein n=1 Tax=Rhododendron molle TaxID=49168 RepID=A0ACC0LFG5_RHOML|nr:hypothetical protein RHMOL_Rhmol12G0049900 [Rhododendron molle]